jgi:hypothetical protein
MPNVPINKKLYATVKTQAKRKFKVWPSAYASGWLVKEYKRKGGRYITYTGKSRRRSPKRSSTRRRSPKRSITRRRSPKRSSTRRRSPKRSSTRRRSPKRSITRRRSPKRSSTRRRSNKRSRSRRRSNKRSRSRRRFGFTRRSPKRSMSRRRSGLSRWFAEEWINVCKLPLIVPCGRNSGKSKKNYPYCRPRYKITSKSPRTAKSFSRAELKRRCSRKRKSPYKRIVSKKSKRRSRR